MSKAQDLADEAFTLFDNLQAQLIRIQDAINENDYGDSGAIAITDIEDVGMKLLKAYTALEDAYASLEDLVEAP